MKTNSLILGFVTALVLFSCKKNDVKKISDSFSTTTEIVEKDGKTDTITSSNAQKDINGKKTSSVSYPYKASDGSRAKATFIDDGKAKTITIEANNNKFVLDFKQATTAGEIYERNSISAESTEDSLLISQGNNVIHLAKVK
ncbi:hypothetical protein [Epilithonimonas hispanica]|uniref:Uncharacterized protein n=1 Tax=Epilithonimonas hispanica TaxID=358687 RepID=A0A3D9D2Y2_9FLAO|nr:hypothetical protein [Epilithonimonas hispanica]REC72297.1 hypothetical protein DRF58_03310 [Epilithonimonas hispanica]